MNDELLRIPRFYNEIKLIEGYMKDVRLVETLESSLRITLSSNFDNTYKTYIVYNITNSMFKIGKSKKIGDRINTLSNMNGTKLLIIKIYPFDIEKKLHNLFSDKRREGEWFILNEDDFGKISLLIKDLI